MKFQIIVLVSFYTVLALAAQHENSIVSPMTQLSIDRSEDDRDQKNERKIYSSLWYLQCAEQLEKIVPAVLAFQKKRFEDISLNLPVDAPAIVQTLNTCFVLLVEFVRYCHERKALRQTINSMTYQEFVTQYPHLVLVQHQINVVKKLIELSVDGSFPEQILARIQLTKISLPHPYAKYAQKAAKKMYKSCFDWQGNFVWVDWDKNMHPYKKFLKQVSGGWPDLVLKSQQSNKDIKHEYFSCYAHVIDTSFNNVLIEIIQAGIQADFAGMQELSKQYINNPVVIEVLNYYAKAISMP